MPIKPREVAWAWRRSAGLQSSAATLIAAVLTTNRQGQIERAAA
ncbi:MAG: hypothetical protein U0075_24540 [Thermomicrobiales bacterium]